MVRRLGTIRTQSDDGRTFFVHEFQEFIDAGTKNGDDWIPGMRFFELNNGSKVNYVDDQTFEIVADGTILRRLR